MLRREMLKLMAVARGATSLSSSDQATTDNQLSLLSGFNQYTRNYAQFCALPPKDRFFYHLSGDRIVEEKLDNDSWKPNGGDPPRIPLPSSWWDNVPLQSPIPNLAGEGPYKPTWDSLLEYEAPEWYRDAKFGIWAHWSPQCVPEAGDWYARNMYLQELSSGIADFRVGRIAFSLLTTGLLPVSATKT